MRNNKIMSDKKNNWLKSNYNYFVDFGIFLFGMTFTVLTMIITSDKFKSFNWVNRHPIFLLIINIAVLVIFAGIKLFYEIQQKAIKRIAIDKDEENKFLNDLIVHFKHQICKPLETVIFNSLKTQGLSENTKYRVTIYTYTHGRFFSIGRFSANPSYQKFGRIAIRDKNELLFKAWNDGELIEDVSPCDKRNMKSVKIAIRYLYETAERKDKFGVIVYETINKKDSKLKNGNLDSMTNGINEYFFEKMNIRQDLNFAMNEEL
jgi:hypothetical protein